MCNAGVIVDATISQTSLEDWQTLLDVNLTAPYLYSVRALPALREAGGGSIVHVSSDAGVWGEEEIGAYSVTKAALITLAQMLAMDAGPSGIRVNAVCPGDILPGMATTTRGPRGVRRHQRLARRRRWAASARPTTWPASCRSCCRPTRRS